MTRTDPILPQTIHPGARFPFGSRTAEGWKRFAPMTREFAIALQAEGWTLHIGNAPRFKTSHPQAVAVARTNSTRNGYSLRTVWACPPAPP